MTTNFQSPFSWAAYTAPGMAMGTHQFFRPDNSQMIDGTDLTNYLTDNGLATPDRVTNRTVKYDGGLTRELLNNTTGFLNTQLGTGFGDLSNMITDATQYGGTFGNANNSVYSPQSKNGYGTQWGNNNPFRIGGF